jgi:DNA-binding NtrC family response regulator
LQNAIERMVAINSGPFLNIVDLPSALQYQKAASEPPCAAAAVAAGSEVAPLVHLAPRPASQTMSDVERETIHRALAETNGDVAKAAHLLDIGRTTLYRKLKEYRIEN